jgi:Flp pilus assembly pilin Flp
MKSSLRTLLARLQNLIPEDAQDLVEYALLVGLIAFGAAASMSTVASGVYSAFSKIGTFIVVHV